MLSKKRMGIALGAAAIAIGLILLAAQAMGGSPQRLLGGLASHDNGYTGGSQTVCPLAQGGQAMPGYQCGCYWSGGYNTTASQDIPCTYWCTPDNCPGPVRCMETCPLIQP